MVEISPQQYTPAMLQDPALEASTLARIAQQRSDLWPVIAKHPNADDELVAWIRARSVQAEQSQAGVAQGIVQNPARSHSPVFTHSPDSAQMHASTQRPAPAQRPASFDGQAWQAGFVSQYGRAPSTEEYRAALAQSKLRSLPAGSSVASASVGQRWPSLIVAICGMLGLFAMLLPATESGADVFGYSLTSRSLSFFDDDFIGLGMVFTLLLVLIVASNVLGFVHPSRWARLVGGITACTAGALIIVNVVPLMLFFNSANMSIGVANVGTSPGAGMILVTLVSLPIVTFGIVRLVRRR